MSSWLRRVDRSSTSRESKEDAGRRERKRERSIEFYRALERGSHVEGDRVQHESVPDLAKLAKNLQIFVDFWPNLPKIADIFTLFGSLLVHVWSSLVSFGPSLYDLGRSLAKLAKNQQIFGDFWPNLPKIADIYTLFCSLLVAVWSSLVLFGPFLNDWVDLCPCCRLF